VVGADNHPLPHGRRLGSVNSSGVAEDATRADDPQFPESRHLVTVGPDEPRLLDVRLSSVNPAVGRPFTERLPQSDTIGCSAEGRYRLRSHVLCLLRLYSITAGGFRFARPSLACAKWRAASRISRYSFASCCSQRRAFPAAQRPRNLAVGASPRCSTHLRGRHECSPPAGLPGRSASLTG
jgi:hypothetical protein